MAEIRWTDEEGAEAVLRDGRLSIFAKPSLRRDDGLVAVGVDVPPELDIEAERTLADRLYEALTDGGQHWYSKQVSAIAAYRERRSENG